MQAPTVFGLRLLNEINCRRQSGCPLSNLVTLADDWGQNGLSRRSTSHSPLSASKTTSTIKSKGVTKRTCTYQHPKCHSAFLARMESETLLWSCVHGHMGTATDAAVTDECAVSCTPEPDVWHHRSGNRSINNRHCTCESERQFGSIAIETGRWVAPQQLLYNKSNKRRDCDTYDVDSQLLYRTS